jgi:hypothetical protein
MSSNKLGKIRCFDTQPHRRASILRFTLRHGIGEQGCGFSTPSFWYMDDGETTEMR